MIPSLSLILSVCAAWELCGNTLRFARSLEELTEFRRLLLEDPGKARRRLCEKPDYAIKLYQKQQGQWLLSCQAPFNSSRLARYWRLEARPKYGMLFLLELPITVSIVILT